LLVDFLEMDQKRGIGVIRQLVAEITPKVYTKLKNMKKLKVIKKQKKSFSLQNLIPVVIIGYCGPLKGNNFFY